MKALFATRARKVKNLLIEDVTVVVVNWLTARRTLGAIESVKRFYPDAPFIVVDDGSDATYKGKFFRVYRGRLRNADIEYDPDTDKLKRISGVKYIQGPDLGLHPISHGHCVDLAMKEIDTRWMLHIHSDYRLLLPGMLEYMLQGIDETYCGVGDEKRRYRKQPILRNVAALYNVEAAKKYDVSFRPVVYYDDGSADVRPLTVPKKPGGKSMEAGAYFIYRLHNLGYKIKWAIRIHARYGVHLRWLEKEKCSSGMPLLAGSGCAV